MRYDCIPIMIRIWNTDKSKCLEDMRQQATLIPWERQNDTIPLERIWWFLIQLNILAPYDLATALLGISKESGKFGPRKNLHKYVFSNFIHNYPNLEADKTSFSGWMDKLWNIQTKNYYSEVFKNELSIYEKTWRNLNAYSVRFSCSVISDFLQFHEPQHARPSCPSPTPRVHPNSCPLSLQCNPTSSSSTTQTFPASWSFQMSPIFGSGGQSSGVSASTSVLLKNTQDWSPLGWTGWISLQSKETLKRWLSRVFSNTTVQILWCSLQYSSVTQSCPTLCNPMKRNKPGLPVHHQLPEFTQTHVHWVSDAI